LREKANPNYCRILTFPKKFVSIDYARTFSADEYDKISYGLIPRAMEDKWFIYLQSDVLYLHRSWTGFCIYKIFFCAEENGYKVAETLTNACEDQAPAFDEDYHVQLLDFLISDLLLDEDKPFPLPKDLGNGPDGLFQHHIAGTHHPEKPSNGDD
jgi:hypothetical protein